VDVSSFLINFATLTPTDLYGKKDSCGGHQKNIFEIIFEAKANGIRVLHFDGPSFDSHQVEFMVPFLQRANKRSMASTAEGEFLLNIAKGKSLLDEGGPIPLPLPNGNIISFPQNSILIFESESLASMSPSFANSTAILNTKSPDLEWQNLYRF